MMRSALWQKPEITQITSVRF